MPLRQFLREHRHRIDPRTPELGSYTRTCSRQGRRVTQEEIAEAIGVSRVWYGMLESRADVRFSTALLDRLANALMLTPEEKVALFELAIPELSFPERLGTASIGEKDVRTGTILDGLPPPLASATAAYDAELDTAAYSLARAREEYHSTGAAITPARARILASWNRCRALGVDPDRGAVLFRDLSTRRAANERLLKAADPIVSYLANRFSDTGYAVTVTDTEGVILEVASDRKTRRELERAWIETGADWSEASAGTNAIGTVLADGRPIQLWASEHFCEGPTALTCIAAPIMLPGALDMAGVLNVSASYKLVRAHLLGVIMQAALEIEEQLEPI